MSLDLQVNLESVEKEKIRSIRTDLKRAKKWRACVDISWDHMPGRDSYMEGAGMLLGNVEKNPYQRPIWSRVKLF